MTVIGRGRVTPAGCGAGSGLVRPNRSKHVYVGYRTVYESLKPFKGTLGVP